MLTDGDVRAECGAFRNDATDALFAALTFFAGGATRVDHSCGFDVTRDVGALPV